jgi:hypothetical protein
MSEKEAVDTLLRILKVSVKFNKDLSSISWFRGITLFDESP